MNARECHPIVLASIIIAASGGFLVGFDIAVLWGARTALKHYFLLNEGSLSIVMASTWIGTILGAMGIRRLVDFFGRRDAMLGIAFLYLLSSLACATAWSSQVFIVVRTLSGVGIGATSVVVPLYIAEIAPAKKRGRFVCLFQLNIVIGILASFISDYFIALISQSEEATWRWMLGVVAIPSTLYLILLFLVPESPRWLVLKGRLHEAVDILTDLGVPQSRDKVAVIQTSFGQKALVGQEPLFQSKYSRPLLLVWILAMLNQLSGINTLMYYAPPIFALAGVGQGISLLQSIAVGCISVLFTVVAMLMIDVLGRRMLIRIGSVGMGICLLIVAWQFSLSLGWNRTVFLSGLLGFIAFFSFSQGAVLWVFISEIFPNAIRSKGQSFGATIYWGMAALISWIFPLVSSAYQPSIVFGFFALMMFLQLLWALYVMPETGRRELEEA